MYKPGLLYDPSGTEETKLSFVVTKSDLLYNFEGTKRPVCVKETERS